MREFILGTDWWTDCDDCMAVRILTNLHKQNKLRLLGIAMSACMPDSVRSLDAFIRDNDVIVPIGIDREAVDFGGRPPYQQRLATLPAVLDNNSAEDGIALYRRLLQAAEAPVELLEIGYPQILANLLKTDAPLVREKVSHLWIMAGKWDKQGARENNFCRNRRASMAGAKLCSEWPSPITFLGWEVGATVISGSHLKDGDILKQALIDHGSPNGRSSWDPLLILLAAAGSPEDADYMSVYGRAEVWAADGSNWFWGASDGPHRYVVKKLPDADYAAKVDAMLDKQ